MPTIHLPPSGTCHLPLPWPVKCFFVWAGCFFLLGPEKYHVNPFTLQRPILPSRWSSDTGTSSGWRLMPGPRETHTLCPKQAIQCNNSPLCYLQSSRLDHLPSYRFSGLESDSCPLHPPNSRVIWLKPLFPTLDREKKTHWVLCYMLANWTPIKKKISSLPYEK